LTARNQDRHQREYLDAVRRVEADPNQDRIPLEIVKRLLDDENPVKVWREHRGLTQQALARAAGLPQSTMARLESGGRRETRRRCASLRRHLASTSTCCRAS
jgi:DNA-binding XRE family transcriptional regulator